MPPPLPHPSTPRPLVLQAEELSPAAAAWLAERCELIACRAEEPQFPALLARAQGLVVRTYLPVHAALLARAPQLRVVGRAGVGLEHIDVAACRARGVRVVHTPDANSDAVAEFVFALLHDAMRPRVFLDKPLDDAAWRTTRAELRAPRQLNELRLAILGLGRIGSRVARIAHAYGIDVMYHDLLALPPERAHGATPAASLDALLAWCDVLTLHVDPRPANTKLVNAAFLARCKPTLSLINTSRGMVVDAPALAAFLRANPTARALLDVHDPEPFGASYPLLGLPNAHLAPHLAAATTTAHENMSWVVRDVWRVINGEEPQFPA
jgi:phosphoglycerate dehydrogenase-like enzyme